MSEPDSVDDPRLAEACGSGEGLTMDGGVTVGKGAIAPSIGQLELCFDPVLPVVTDLATQEMVQQVQQQAAEELAQQRRRWEEERTGLQAEVSQTRSLLRNQVERIHDLEQALDQSQASLNEMRMQMVAQEFLENQLASTEEFANIQHQVILRLKLQLAQPEISSEGQEVEGENHDRNLQDLLQMLETLAQAQQTKVEALRSQLARDRTEGRIYQQTLEQQLAESQAALSLQQQRVLELETEALTAHLQQSETEAKLAQTQAEAQSQIQLVAKLQATAEQLKTELSQMQQAVDLQPLLPFASPAAAHQTNGSAETERDLAIAQAKVEELETEIARQLTGQARLQHVWQELEEERDRQQSRVADLERQTHDMQEQILRQAQQASEYETAVQHWKDRYITNQSRVLRLKELLEQTYTELPSDIVEVLIAIQATTTGGIPEPASPAQINSSSLTQNTKVDLPEFLLRRRSYKTKRS